MTELSGLFILFGAMFLIVLLILWIVLPFAIFGTKDKLDQLIKQAKLANAQLEEVLSEMSGPTYRDSDN